MNPQDNNPNLGQSAPTGENPNLAQQPNPLATPEPTTTPITNPAEPITNPTAPITNPVAPTAGATAKASFASVAGVAAEKAGMSVGVKILLGVLALVLVGGGVFAGVTLLNNDKKNDNQAQNSSTEQPQEQNADKGSNAEPAQNSEIAIAANKMNEINGYKFTVTMTTKNQYMDIDTNSDCAYDGINKIEYCKTSYTNITTEQYYDMKAGKSYSKSSVSPTWTSVSVGEGVKTDMITQIPKITVKSSESINGGTKYTGIINTSELNVFNGTNDNNITVETEDTAIEVFVNSEGYIETMDATIKETIGGFEMEGNIHVQYSDFDTVQSLAIPEEAKAGN